MGKRMRVSAISAIVVLGALIGGSPAAAQVTVGQTVPPGVTPELCDFGGAAFDEIQPSVAAGASYVVPAAGVLTSWSTSTGPTAGQLLGLKVYRRVGAFTYTVVSQDGPKPLTPGVLNTYPVTIPVLAGDVLGITMPSGAKADCSLDTGLEGDEIRFKEGNVPAGGSIEFPKTMMGSATGYRLNVSATLLSPPTIAALSPASGSIKGVKTTISGANFAGVSAVSFGGVPAKSFTVDSEGQITATAPASKKISEVPITVTTVAGTATSATTYAYEGCKIPKLDGKKLKASKKKARRADCEIGKVTKKGDATAKTGEVVKQNPKPGKILPPGTKIKVTLGE